MNKMKRNSTTAARLKEAMELRGKKQVDLVNETGLNRGTISRYLSGEYEPKQNAIYKLSIALDCSEMWLWGYDVPAERPAEQKKNDALADIIVRMRTDEEFFNYVMYISKLSAEDFDKAKNVLHALFK